MESMAVWCFGEIFLFLFFYCDYFLVFSCSLSVVTVNTPALSLGWTHSVTDTCWIPVERNAKKIEYYSIFSALRESRATATATAIAFVIKLKTPEIVKLKKVLKSRIYLQPFRHSTHSRQPCDQLTAGSPVRRQVGSISQPCVHDHQGRTCVTTKTPNRRESATPYPPSTV